LSLDLKRDQGHLEMSFCKTASKKSNANKKTTTKTFFRLIGVAPPTEEEIEKKNILWSLSFIPNKIREFIYKFKNNILGLNTRISHFNLNVSRACSFCILRNVLALVPDEKFQHLFFSCPSTSNIQSEIKNKF
jgi:zinc-binding in reverse transcriptase